MSQRLQCIVSMLAGGSVVGLTWFAIASSGAELADPPSTLRLGSESGPKQQVDVRDSERWTELARERVSLEFRVASKDQDGTLSEAVQGLETIDAELDEQGQSYIASRIERYIDKEQESLDDAIQRSREASDSLEATCEVASRIYSLERHRAYRSALENDRYFLARNGEVLNLGGLGISMVFPWTHNGEAVDVVIVAMLDEYPGLREARAYRDELRAALRRKKD